MARARLPSLDLVRGGAILAVLLFHFRVACGIPAIDAVTQPLFALGWAGVDLFFVLSGFLVGRIILSAAASPDGLDRVAFFRRRALRLWPVLWLYLAAMLAIGGAPAWRMLWPVLLHVQNYASASPSHLWSLAVEEHFYLGAAFALPALLHAGGHRLVERALLALMAGCLVLRLGGLWMGVPLLALQWQTQYRLDAPAFGVLLASCSLHRPALFAALARRRRTLAAVAVLGMAALIAIGDGALRHGIGFTVAYLAAGAIVVPLAAADRPIGGLARGGAALGPIAYPLYIWHASIGALVRGTVPAAPPLATMTAELAAAILAAALIHRWIERPIMHAGSGSPAWPPMRAAPVR